MRKSNPIVRMCFMYRDRESGVSVKHGQPPAGKLAFQECSFMTFGEPL